MALNNIKRHSVKPGAIRTVVLNTISPETEMDIECLGQSNFSFMNDQTRGAGSEEVKAILGRTASTPEQREKNRLANRETLAKHSVKAVRGFYYDHPTEKDEDGDPMPDLSNPVPSDAKGIRDAVMALPDDMFADLMTFALDENNFRPSKKPTMPVGEVAKK